jgi:hypothetical protein
MSPSVISAPLTISEDSSLSVFAVVGQVKAFVKSVQVELEYLRSFIVGAVPEAMVPKRT